MQRATGGDPLARLLWRFALLLAGICCLTLVAGTYFVQATLRVAQDEAFQARFVLTAQRAATAAENALALGVPLASGTPVAALLEREAALEPALLSFAITNAQDRVLLQAGGREAVRAGPAPRPALASAAIRNDLGQNTGWARLRYDEAALHAARARLQRGLWQALVPALLLVGVGLAAWCAWLVRRAGAPAARRGAAGDMRTRLVWGAALLLGAALLWMGWCANAAARDGIGPDQIAKAQAVARSSAALVARALQVGVPAGELAGVPEHVAALHAQSPEIQALAVVAPDGRLLGGSPVQPGPWTVSAPVALSSQAAPVAQVLLQLDPQVLARRLQGMLLDIAFLGVICLLLSLEWVALGLGTRGARALAVLQERRQGRARTPAAWRPSGAAAVRPALFLFMLSEELTRPFMPTWARTLAPVQWGWPAEWLAGLPLTVFLALVALLQWPLAAASERVGRRPGLVLGALLAAAGLAWAALVPQFQALMAARVLGAVGFAMVFVSAQGAVIDASGAADRARSLGQFVRAILVAGLCGPPLGGMAAQHWGVPGALALAAGVALLAALVARLQMAAPRTAPTPAPAPGPAPVTAPPAATRRGGCASPGWRRCCWAARCRPSCCWRGCASTCCPCTCRTWATAAPSRGGCRPCIRWSWCCWCRWRRARPTDGNAAPPSCWRGACWRVPAPCWPGRQATPRWRWRACWRGWGWARPCPSRRSRPWLPTSRVACLRRRARPCWGCFA